MAVILAEERSADRAGRDAASSQYDGMSQEGMGFQAGSPGKRRSGVLAGGGQGEGSREDMF